MNFYDHPQTLLGDFQYGSPKSFRQSDGALSLGQRSRCFFGKPQALSLALIVLSSAEVFAAEAIKLGYAALTAGQVAPWMAKEAGYFSKYGIEAELIYIPQSQLPRR
jgi:uncharacterized SAM-binding protein YcdF (DUF218 family)